MATMENGPPDEKPVLDVNSSGTTKILNLCQSLCDNSTRKLEVKINEYLLRESNSELAFIIHIMQSSDEAVIQVINTTIFETPIRTQISSELLNRIARYVNTFFTDRTSDTKQFTADLIGVLTDASVLQRVQNNDISTSSTSNNVGNSLGSDSKAIVFVPICGPFGRNIQHFSSDYTNNGDNAEQQLPVLIVCLVNSLQMPNRLVQLVAETFRYCLTLLVNTGLAEEEARQKLQCQALLQVARKLFSHLTDLDNLLKEIMSEARRLTNAERCSLFLLDDEHMQLVARVFDGVSSTEASNDVRLARDQGIAGHVATTGKLLNIKSAYDHPLFYKGMDEVTGFKTRNILCFPICDESSIVGVAQLCNKRGGSFDCFDEEIANAFSIYCGLSIVHTLVYKQIQEAQARSNLSNELMMYHMKVSTADIYQIVNCSKSHINPEFETFTFSPREIPYEETVCFVLDMFERLDLLETFRIRRETLTKFIMFVQKGYRHPPYHNWMHAFSVTHFAYLCLRNFQLIEHGFFTKLEALAYLVSSLCHDLDHRGTTNSFQEGSNSVLAHLYSSEGSVMERHHLAQTICTLNTEGCNFLETLNRDDYIRCLDLMKDMILATDLTTHFTIYQKQLEMVKNGYSRSITDHRYYLLCLLMTCADLSDQTKSWIITKSVAQYIYDEFFTQGDMEKKMGKKPLEMMDRDHASIPDLQICFLTSVCLPVFKLLVPLFANAQQLVDTIEHNIECWQASKDVFQRLCASGMSSLQALASVELEETVLNAL